MLKNLLICKINQRKSMQNGWPAEGRYFISGKISNPQERRDRSFKSTLKCNYPTLVIASLLLGFIFIAPTFGVAVEDLRVPIQNLKQTIFGGWMWVPKIGAAVGGCLLAVYNQSIMPLATGAGIGLGIHFYELYINADGALI